MSNDPQATPQPCTTDTLSKLKFFVKKKNVLSLILKLSLSSGSGSFRVRMRETFRKQHEAKGNYS